MKTENVPAAGGTVPPVVRPLRFLTERAEGFPCRVADCIHHDEDFEQHCMAQNEQRLAGPEWCSGYKPGDIE